MVKLNIPKEQIIRDSPFNFIIATPVRNTVSNTRIRASVSRDLVTNMVDMPSREAPKHANLPKAQYFDSFSTHLDR